MNLTEKKIEKYEKTKKNSKMWKFVQANEEKTNYSFVLATNSSNL